MPELDALLTRAAPRPSSPLDVGHVARTARRRTRRRRGTTALAGVAAVAGLALGVASLATDRPSPAESVRAAAPEPPALPPVVDGMGTWSALPDAPVVGLREAAVLADGRLLAWGDQREMFGDDQDPGDATLAVALYDPAAETWAAPPAPDVLRASTEVQVRFAADQLVAIGVGTDGVVQGAHFDAATATWRELPRLEALKVELGAIAWDGDTLALVRTSPGDAGPVGLLPGSYDVNDPDAGTVELDWRIDAPQTWRWEVGADRWVSGAPAPLALRIASGDAFDGRRLAVVGGTTGPSGTGDASLSRDDGAVYDLATDAWAPLPPVPWAAVHPSVGWIEGQLVVAGGQGDLQLGPEDEDPFARAVELAADGSWTPLGSASRDGAAVSWPSAHEAPTRGEPLVVATSNLQSEDQVAGDARIDGAWEVTPTRHLRRWGDRVLATSQRVGNPGDGRFAVEVRRGPDDWAPTAEAPFANRSWAAVAMDGDRLYVGGGFSTSGWTPEASFWVLDLGTD